MLSMHRFARSTFGDFLARCPSGLGLLLPGSLAFLIAGKSPRGNFQCRLPEVANRPGDRIVFQRIGVDPGVGVGAAIGRLNQPDRDSAFTMQGPAK